MPIKRVRVWKTWKISYKLSAFFSPLLPKFIYKVLTSKKIQLRTKECKSDWSNNPFIYSFIHLFCQQVCNLHEARFGLNFYFDGCFLETYLEDGWQYEIFITWKTKAMNIIFLIFNICIRKWSKYNDFFKKLLV